MRRLAVGDRLAGRYEIRAITAERPTGMLYRGFDEQIGVEVALRVIDDELLVGEDERRSFVQKASRARTLQHPNLMRLYDVLVDDDAVFLVMQWAPGDRLSRRLASGSLPLAEARLVLRRTAAGIAHAHAHGVVLGNIRPDTVMLYPDGLKLTNVGIGPALPRERYLQMMERRNHTSELAPEILGGRDPDERSDLYSLALLAKTLVMTAPESSAPSALESTRPVIERALSSDATQRPRDAETFAREVEAAIEGRHEVTHVAAPPVPTGSDTERVTKIDPAMLFDKPDEGGTQKEQRPSADLVLERGSDAADGPTDPRARFDTGAVEHEIDSGELVEVPEGVAGEGMTAEIPRLSPQPKPEVTDVGHRSPVTDSAELEVTNPRAVLPLPPSSTPLPQINRGQGTGDRGLQSENVGAAAAAPAPAITPTAPSFSADTAAPVAAPLTPVVPPSAFDRPAQPIAPPSGLPMSPTALEDFDSHTNPVPRIEGRLPGAPAPHPPAAKPPIPSIATATLPAAPKGMGAAIIILGLVFGLGGAAVIWMISHPAPTTTIIVTQPVAAPPPPTPVVTPSPSPSPVVTPLAPEPACPLGMAELSSPHRFCIDQYEYPGGRTIPRTAVSFADAEQICTSRGLRLCTDPEWEQACRGPSGASYPYGSHFDGQRCNTGGKGTAAILPAGSLQRCRSQAGAYDMSGNVAEWTAGGSQRGGSAQSAAFTSRCSHVVKNADKNGATDVGFRCCRDQR